MHYTFIVHKKTGVIIQKQKKKQKYLRIFLLHKSALEKFWSSLSFSPNTYKMFWKHEKYAIHIKYRIVL